MTVENDAPDPTSSLLAFFGSELRRVRTEQGVSQGEAAKRAHTTQSMISLIEAAKRVPSHDLARDLDSGFSTGGHFERIYPLVIKYAYPSWFLPFIELERDATEMRVFESQIVPGLLQTEEYVRAMMASVRPDNLEDLVAARMTRQQVFEREKPPRTWFIIDENVLTRPIGGASAFSHQLERLLRAAEDPRTVIQVLPRSVVAHPGLAGPFTLLGFDEGADVLYVEGFSQGRTGIDPTEVSDAVRSYDLLRASALSPQASADLIGTHLKEQDQ